MNHLWTIVAAALLCIVLGIWIGNRVRRFWLRRTLARRFRRARKGEARARDWLEGNGFTVMDEQVSQQSVLIVNGEEAPFVVRADYVVERDGVRAVVEVKTGAVANPSARETRRQILEYAWVYNVREVYLFDADCEELHSIRVPSTGPEASRPRKAWLAALPFTVGIVIGVLAQRMLR